MKWNLWVDYHRTDEQGLTHANVRNAAAGINVQPGSFLIVGNEDADPAVAEVVAVMERGTVLLRVLPGPVEQHLPLVTARPGK